MLEKLFRMFDEWRLRRRMRRIERFLDRAGLRGTGVVIYDRGE